MKKLFIQQPRKKYLANRSIDELKKKKRHERKLKKDKSKKLHRNKSHPIYGKRARLKLPEYFSIINNTEDTMLFFSRVTDLIEKRRSLYFDMANVKQMTLDALLYIQSIFDYFNLKRINIDIKGNTPNNKECENLFLGSGFFDDVRSDVSSSKINDDILTLKSGTLVDPIVAAEVIRFAIKHKNENESIKTRNIYRILLEMMGNTHNHAYKFASDASKWYLIAHNDARENKVRFAFLDGGLGIPTTIRKSGFERFREAVYSIIKTSNDSQLIMSALNGDFRTRTNVGYRGKGLPTIYKCFESGHIEKLRIVANNGFVNIGNPEKLASRFQGTLYTWNFV